MTDAVKIAAAAPKILSYAMAETDMSLVELAAVFRVAAESCTQAQLLQEVALTMAKLRGHK